MALSARSPTDGTATNVIDQVQPNGHLTNDIEGVTLVAAAGGNGYIIASAQGAGDPSHSYFVVYDRQTGAST